MTVQRQLLMICVVLVSMFFSFGTMVSAQDDAQTCEAIVQYSLGELANNCAGLERGLTCQGNWSVSSYSFTDEEFEDDYGNAGDTLPLDVTQMIQTGSTNLEEGIELNVMNVDADIPAGAGNGVVYLQLGGVEVENAVDDDDLAQGLTPMQNFYFRTGLGENPCPDEAPSFLFVQAPENQVVNLGIYDQPVQLNGASVVLRSFDTDGDGLPEQLELVVLSGLVTLYPDSASPILVAPGFAVTLQLGPEILSLGIQGDADEKSVIGQWSAPRALTADELEDLEIIEDFPDNVINFPVDVPGVIVPSGLGGVTSVLDLPANSPALAAAVAACNAGQLPEATCDYLGL